jgi:hypothetical protein
MYPYIGHPTLTRILFFEDFFSLIFTFPFRFDNKRPALLLHSECQINDGSIVVQQHSIDLVLLQQQKSIKYSVNTFFWAFYLKE